MSTFYIQPPKTLQTKYPIFFSTKNLYYCRKMENLENLKSNLSKNNYPDSLIKQRVQKALSMPQKDLQKPKKLSNENILPFITTFNPNSPNIYSTIKSSDNCLINNSISGFLNIKLIQSKRQPPISKNF